MSFAVSRAPRYRADVATNPPTATPERTLAVHAVEHAPDGVIVVGGDGQILYANAAMAALVGGETPLVGRNVDELVPDVVRRRHAQLRSSFADAPAQRPMGVASDLTLRRADGTELPVEISLSPFEDDGLRIVAAVRDVTERRLNEQRLAAANQQIALLDERERIGRDLHDVVLQRLYGTGLTVQAIGTGADEATRERLDGVIDEIDRIISEVRTIVFTLGNTGRRGALGQELADVVAQASRVLGFTPALRLEGPVESALSDEMRAEMIASMREALGNVARHASAGVVDVTIAVVHEMVTMVVADDGVGPPVDVGGPASGNGLVNMSARAEVLGGDCVLQHRAGGGAELIWSVPY